MADSIPLYRFFGQDAGLHTLVDGRFRVGELSKFNDPFEWHLGFAGITTPEEQKVADAIKSNHRSWVESWMGVLSFSAHVSDPVLWSVYADKHKGVAFEVNYPWQAGDIIKMEYSKQRPVLDFRELRKYRDGNERDSYLMSLLRRLMHYKPAGFAFEQEYRLHINLNDAVRCRFYNGNHYWQAPDGSLTRVILGFQCPLEEAVVRKLLDMNGFTDTVAVRARLCQETYSIIV